ncbi:NEW3 domain-containing protein [Brevirhabdus pacifica]|uniref:COG1470 family protein n=1 Tax=Brevirhabdus pacifica TaxID=1267768 RepID=UPI001E2F1A19|nr:NEW3 domain-containing protein [Brevirhabdus pacifica]
MAVLSVLGAAAYAAAPEAGSVIGNQAVATYTNNAGDEITVTSNKVETVVQQVAGVTLTSDNTESIAPGGKAFLPHIVTNDGNGPDFFALSATEDNSGTLDTASLVFYPDADMDGVADSATPITSTPTLAPGEQFGFIIEATAPSDGTGSDSITVTSVSNLDGTIVDTNTDTLTISNAAIMELVKSMTVDPTSGPGNDNLVDAGDTVVIKLTYSSTGLAAANNYAVQDILNNYLTYDPNTAVWSDAAGTLDETNGNGVDASNGSGDTIAWTESGQTVGFTLSSVPSGRSGSVTFTATINDAVPAGIIPNTATQSIDGTASAPSNTASIVVDANYNVEISDTATNPDGSPNTAIASANDQDGLSNDVVNNQTDAYQGATIPFEFVITNLSNETDSFTLDVSNVDFPAGTSFRMVQSDGITPVVGSVGPLATNDSVKVILLATLPTDVTPVPTSEYTANVTTTSEGSGLSDSSTAEFTGQVLAAAVDLENKVVGSEGDGAAPTDGGNPWITKTTDPGQTTSFVMNVENGGPTSDSYNLSLAQALPDGWTVEFRLADGTVVTNTGTIPSGGNKDFYVYVTPPEGTPPGDTLVDIKVLSAVSGQSDRIVNQVTVNKVIDVEIVADQATQASPGGIVDMVHTVTNNSNIAITEGDILQTGLTNFSGAIYYDANGNGVIDASELVIDNFDDLTDGLGVGVNGLAAGDSVSLIYRVQTPSTATPGVTEIGTVSLDTSLNGADAEADSDTANNAVEDRITIISGDVTLTKYQYVDPLCDGTVGTWTKVRQDVNPGQCVRYLIEAENTGTSNASNVKISDVAPAYTLIHNCGGACSPTTYPAAPNSSYTATGTTIDSSHNTVIPGEFAKLEFTVKVDQ